MRRTRPHFPVSLSPVSLSRARHAFSPVYCHRYRRTRAGTTVVELLVGSLLALLTGAALFNLMQANYTGQSAVQGQNFANASSRQALDILEDTLRNAQSIQSGSVFQALAAASDSDVTCYTGSNASQYTRIWLSNGTLWRTKTIAGIASAPEPLTIGVQSLTMTYLVPAGGQYTAASGSWSVSAGPNGELPNIGAVQIHIVVTINGSTRALESFVRLRNSPYSHVTSGVAPVAGAS